MNPWSVISWTGWTRNDWSLCIFKSLRILSSVLQWTLLDLGIVVVYTYAFVGMDEFIFFRDLMVISMILLCLPFSRSYFGRRELDAKRRRRRKSSKSLYFRQRA